MLSAFLLDPHDLGDQALRHHARERSRGAARDSASAASMFGISARKPSAPVKRVKPAAQADEFWPVGERQPEQFADHRQRQLARIALDEVGRASVRKQFIGEFVAEGAEYAAPCRARRGGETPRRRCRATACDPARPSTACCWTSVRTMPGIHQRSPATVPSSLRMVKVVGVLQHLIGERLRRRGPDLADDREVHFHDRPRGTKLLDRGGGIAKVVLTGEV